MIAARQMAFGRSSRKKEEQPAYWGLCFTAEEDGATIGMNAVGSAPALTLETSYDGEAWEPFYVGETSIALKKGERVYFRAGEGGNAKTASSLSNYNNFSIADGRVSASGDIASLLNGDSPDSAVASYSYANLFNSCTSLTHAPELPATTLGSYCYRDMFNGCTSLTHAPELPATTLSLYCYGSMFKGCTSLIHAAKIHAKTFTSTSSFNSMFFNCINLNRIEFSAKSFRNGFNDWVYGVSPTGTFVCPTALGTNDTILRGIKYCPEGWAVINKD